MCYKESYKVKKQKTLKQILDNPPELPVIPLHVWTKLGDKHVSVYLNQVSFGESDFASLEEMRLALDWYVEQFGGEVKWK